MLQVEAVHKSFGDFTAVYGANLTVEQGELVAVIGPNGAGKTTLFNLISGQLKADKGKIVFKGEEINGLPPYEICKRGIGRSFQIVNIFRRLTVFENVQVAVLSQQRQSSNLFSPAQNLAVEETHGILESVGLSDKASNIAGSLSHGDQKILEIAIALGNEPELLILDEPTAGMSPEETAATMELIKGLGRRPSPIKPEGRGLTILFCEHDMEVVFDIAQSIMVMHHGQTLIQGKPEEVRRNKAVQEAYLGFDASVPTEPSSRAQAEGLVAAQPNGGEFDA
jgi:branched-chain amino acid transport system ATP-binding protein